MGKESGVAVPGEIAERVGLKNGERLQIDTRDDEIVIRRSTPRFELEELFKGKSPKQWRMEYAKAFDWGPDVGREIVEE